MYRLVRYDHLGRARPSGEGEVDFKGCLRSGLTPLRFDEGRTVLTISLARICLTFVGVQERRRCGTIGLYWGVSKTDFRAHAHIACSHT